MTTNTIAARAGVSIGSLYQYFPNRLSILRALRERHFRRFWRAIGEECAKVTGIPLGDAIRRVIRASSKLSRENGPLLRLFVKELPAYDMEMDHLIVAKSALHEQLRSFFLAHKTEIKPGVEEAIFVVPTLARGIGTAFAAEGLSRPENITAEEQITSAIIHYLTKA